MKSVVITDLRTAEMREAQAYLAEQGYRVLVPPEGCRLWKEEEVRAFAADCPPDLAGVIHPAPPPFQCPLEQAEEETVAAARDDGILAAWCVTKVFGVRFRDSGGGTIIYVTSIHAEQPAGYGFLVSSGCGAVQMLTREVNQDYGTAGVHSYFIQRGPSETDPDLKSDLTHFYYGTDLRYPERKLPASGALNALIAFLLTPAAAPLAGSDLRADGGMTMYYGERCETAARPAHFAPSPAWMPEKDRPKEERVALVTGSGKGVGAGIVRVLSAAGMKCVINCNTNRNMAEETLEGIRRAGGEAMIIQADVSRPEQVQMMVEKTIEAYGRLDVLVNNAAMQYNRFVDQYDEELIRKLWDINFGGYWRMIKAALPWLRKSPMPRIINIGSIHGKRPTCFDAGYAVTKGGIKMLTREAALELQPDNIPVVCLSLGGCKIEFKTGMADFCNQRPKETGNPGLRSPIRLVLPEEVGETVRFLCSETGAALTGDCIRIDCGQILK